MIRIFDDFKIQVLNWIKKHKPVLMHNLSFDQNVLKIDLQQDLNLIPVAYLVAVTPH